MKYILYILILFGIFSCNKIEDHYRILDVSILVSDVSKGPNAQCINIGDEADSTYEDLLVIKIEFIREYYSTDSSRSTGIMYSPRGWEGCSEKITKLDLISDSININKLLFGDTTITGIIYSTKGLKGCGEKISKLNLISDSINNSKILLGDTTINVVDKDKIISLGVQEKFDCDCFAALSITSIDSLVELFNTQHQSKTRIFIGEQYDQTPFVFFIRKKDIESLNGKEIKLQLEMSNGDIIKKKSNKIIIKI